MLKKYNYNVLNVQRKKQKLEMNCMSMFNDENIINFLVNEKYNLSGYICILEYIQMTSNSNLEIIKLLCDYADELLEMVKFIERCFFNVVILTLEDKMFLEKIKQYKEILEVSEELKILESIFQKQNL